jgi:hypothetical protein
VSVALLQSVVDRVFAGDEVCTQSAEAQRVRDRRLADDGRSRS